MKPIKQITLGAIITATLLFLPSFVFAQTITPTGTQNKTDRLAKLHTQCDTDINKRLKDLYTALNKINNLVKLPSDKKSQYSSEINTNITGLANLKAKCDADIDLPTLHPDYNSVFTKYKIYAVFLPQIHLLITTDDLGVTADMISDFSNKLQTRIQSAWSPSNLTSLLSDMQAKIADAHTQYNNAAALVSALTPQSYNTDKQGTEQAFKNAKADINVRHMDTKVANQDAREITQGLKGTKSTTSSPTPTP